MLGLLVFRAILFLPATVTALTALPAFHMQRRGGSSPSIPPEDDDIVHEDQHDVDRGPRHLLRKSRRSPSSGRGRRRKVTDPEFFRRSTSFFPIPEDDEDHLSAFVEETARRLVSDRGSGEPRKKAARAEDLVRFLAKHALEEDAHFRALVERQRMDMEDDEEVMQAMFEVICGRAAPGSLGTAEVASSSREGGENQGTREAVEKECSSSSSSSSAKEELELYRQNRGYTEVSDAPGSRRDSLLSRCSWRCCLGDGAEVDGHDVETEMMRRQWCPWTTTTTAVPEDPSEESIAAPEKPRDDEMKCPRGIPLRGRSPATVEYHYVPPWNTTTRTCPRGIPLRGDSRATKEQGLRDKRPQTTDAVIRAVDRAPLLVENSTEAHLSLKEQVDQILPLAEKILIIAAMVEVIARIHEELLFRFRDEVSASLPHQFLGERFLGKLFRDHFERRTKPVPWHYRPVSPWVEFVRAGATLQNEGRPLTHLECLLEGFPELPAGEPEEDLSMEGNSTTLVLPARTRLRLPGISVRVGRTTTARVTRWAFCEALFAKDDSPEAVQAVRTTDRQSRFSI